MSLTNLEITLQSALQDFGIRALPPEWTPNGDTALVDGIALVVKSTGKEYVRLSSIDGKISVVRDYGQCAMIIRIEKIFAVSTITKFDIPRFNSDAEIIHYLSKSVYDRAEIESLLSTDNKTTEAIERDRNEINRRINDLAIGFQKRKIEERKRVDEIKEYSEAVKAEKAKSKTNGRKRTKKD